MIGERVYSAQETAHLLLGLPIVKSTFSSTVLNLGKDGNLRQIQTEPDVDLVTPEDGRTVTGISWMQRYLKRDGALEGLSMQEVLQRYSWRNRTWKAKEEDTTTIVRVYPRLSPNPEGDVYEEYCRIKCLLHHPFHTNPSHLLSINVNGTPMQRTWTDLFLECERNHHHPNDTLRNWKEESKTQDEEVDEDEDLLENMNEILEEDWMLYQRLFGVAAPDVPDIDLGSRPIDNMWDTNEGRLRWRDSDLMASYVTERRRAEIEADDEHEADDNEELNNDSDCDKDDSGHARKAINIKTLSPEQSAVLMKFVSTYKAILCGAHVPQMKLNIDGTAGCGKSYLIMAICQELRRLAKEHGQPDPIRVMALSGVAALNTNGRTMHSSLGIPATNGPFLPLSGSRLATLQQQWNGIHFVIIDEKSMLGLKMFAKVESRLRQLVPGSTLEFAGLHIAIIGDFAQLPPVKDRALYCQPPSDATENAQLAQDGFALYQGFTSSLRLHTIFRQKDSEFRELLGRASNGGLTHNDWRLLLTRYKENLLSKDQDEFKDVTTLYTTAEVVEADNLSQLAALKQPCARIYAKNDGRDAKRALSEDAGGLENELVLARGAKVMVTRNLWQNQGHYILYHIVAFGLNFLPH
jgi:hypothetical protein